MKANKIITNTIVTTTFLLTGCAGVDYDLKGERPDVNPGDVTECPFSAVSDTKISSYDCNPVFQEENGDVGSVGFYATDVMGHPFYQMWYTSHASSEDFSAYSMNYAVSSDGTNWKTHEQNPLFEADSSSWDKDSIAGQVIVWDPIDSQYVMAYQGVTLGTGEFDPDTWEIDNGIWGLGIATSPNGVDWNRSSSPAINFNDFDPLFGGSTISPCWPLTITLTNRGAFRGYIAAAKADEAMFGEAACHMYAMTGVDAKTWIIDESDPVFEAGADYDSKGFTSATVVELDGTLYMFYIGFTTWEEQEGYQSARNMTLNLATSTDDGENWTRDPDNPLPISSSGIVGNVAAQVIGERIHLWVTDDYDGKQAVGYFLYEPKIDEHE